MPAMESAVPPAAKQGPREPLPLDRLDRSTLRRIDWVLFDIDDTLTTDGALTAEAHAALERLRDAGLKLVPLTGRPAGWCDMMARFWPVEAVVGENGAFWFRYERDARRMRRHFWATAEARGEARARLEALGRAIVAAVPGAAIAADQPYRAADLAIDFAEDVAPLDRAAIDRILAMFREAGAEAKISSIHVNGWFGTYDKLSMTRTLFADVFGVALDDVLPRVAFIGDSANDEPLFASFPLAVGVANVRAFLEYMTCGPAYVTAARSGAGFAEFARAILAARGARPGETSDTR